MNKPSDKIIETVAPSREIEGLPISDGYSIRNVAHAEQRDTLRLPRGGPYDATFVAVKKFYDGSGGGEAGHYVMAFVEFRAEGSRWRTAGLKIRAEEAIRVAHDMVKGKLSAPVKGEAPRVGGKLLKNDKSTLCGTPIDSGYLLYVRNEMRSKDGPKWGRTRGVELQGPEVAMFCNLLVALKDVR